MIKKFLKIDSIALTKLNNAEYITLMTRLLEEITKVEAKNIGITQEYTDSFKENLRIISDVFAQNNAHIDSASLLELDNQRDMVWQHIFGAIRNDAKSPMAAEREANQVLVSEIKPYNNKTNIALEQETQLIRGFLFDMDKPTNKPHLIALNLLPATIELNRLNEEFARLHGKRTLDQLDKLPACKPLRKTMDEQFLVITQSAYAINITIPTEQSTSFIMNTNIYIKTAKDAYTLRMAHSSKKTKEVAPEVENGSNMIS